MKKKKYDIDEIAKSWLSIHKLFEPIKNNEEHEITLEIIGKLMDIVGEEKSPFDLLIDFLGFNVQAYELSIYPELQDNTPKQLCTTANHAKQNSNGQ